MNCILKKKIVLYILIIPSLVFICLMGNLLVDSGNQYSVMDVLRGSLGVLPNNIDATMAFYAGVSFWVYILLPIADLPFASYISDERKSRYILFEKIRKGTLRHVLLRLALAFISNAVINLTFIMSYAVITYCFFGTSVSGEEIFWTGVLNKFVYVQIYSFSLSVLTALCIYIYNDLLVDISLVIVLNYLFRNFMGRDELLYPVTVIFISGIAYMVMRRLRCDIL
ncbi:MAG: hypothetical protein ACOX76_09415 [Lachnospiraceae bacterium]